MREIFAGYGLSGDTLGKVVEGVTSDKARWTEFMMRFELGLDKPDPKRAPISAATIAVAYLVGGLVPLAPYIFAPSIESAFRWFGGRDGVRAAHFRRRERPLRWTQSLCLRRADSAGRRACRGGRLLARASHCLTADRQVRLDRLRLNGRRVQRRVGLGGVDGRI